ncbi:hypothetical protein KEJ39_08850 [Candidatus Bathyarchaeota archaeon]|nr:hypothetical protein [Candidatus Bathyarchaeota archaeon]
MSEEDIRRRLAEMKSYLEKRVAELTKESAELNSFLEVIDTMLAEKSFRRVALPAERIGPPDRPLPERGAALPVEEQILAAGGVRLGEMLVEGKTLTVIPNESLRFDVDSPPMRAFLVAKVLEPMKARDAELCRDKKKRQAEAFTYHMDEDYGNLRALIIHNFGDGKRLLELKNAIRWTLRRIYEKTSK